MIKKIFLKKNDRGSRYWMFEGAQTKNFELQDLSWLLESDEYTWLHIIEDKKNNKIILWSEWGIKKKATLIFNDVKEQREFEAAYLVYSRKRWFDMPKLEMSKENYKLVVRQWKKILKSMPEYIIFSQDDLGHVEIVGKDELSEQDLKDMKRENEKCLRYQKAREKYINSFNPPYNSEWHSPADDEYEADFKKFFDED